MFSSNVISTAVIYFNCSTTVITSFSKNNCNKFRKSLNLFFQVQQQKISKPFQFCSMRKVRKCIIIFIIIFMFFVYITIWRKFSVVQSSYRPSNGKKASYRIFWYHQSNVTFTAANIFGIYLPNLTYMWNFPSFFPLLQFFVKKPLKILVFRLWNSIFINNICDTIVVWLSYPNSIVWLRFEKKTNV